MANNQRTHKANLEALNAFDNAVPMVRKVNLEALTLFDRLSVRRVGLEVLVLADPGAAWSVWQGGQELPLTLEGAHGSSGAVRGSLAPHRP